MAVAQAARDLDVAEIGLGGGRGNGQMRADQAEIAALKKAAARLCEEHEILKNRQLSFRAKGELRSAFLARHRRIWPVSWRCEVLEVSPSGCHVGSTACQAQATLPQRTVSSARRENRNPFVVFVDNAKCQARFFR